MRKIITMINTDGQNILKHEKSAQRSSLLKGLIHYIQDSFAPLPIPSVRGEVLNKIVEYLTHYIESEPKVIPKPVPSANLLEVTDEWDVKFINSVDLDTTFDIINAAHYMDIPPLLNLACAKIAVVMTVSTREELIQIFNIECDITQEELKEYEDSIN